MNACLKQKIMEMPLRWEWTGQSLHVFHNVSYNTVLLQYSSARIAESTLINKEDHYKCVIEE